MGDVVSLIANHFEISKIPDIAIFQYDISMTKKEKEGSSRKVKTEKDPSGDESKKPRLPLWLRTELFQQQAVQERLGEGGRSFIFDCIFHYIISRTNVKSMQWHGRG